MQVHSMLVFEGPGLASRMRKELVDRLSENRYPSLDDVLGADHEDIYWRRREESVWRLMREKGKAEKEIVELQMDCKFGNSINAGQFFFICSHACCTRKGSE